MTEDRDTDVDPERPVIRRRRKAAARPEPSEPSRQLAPSPVHRGKHVPPSEALSSASAATVRIREAVVRLQAAPAGAVPAGAPPPAWRGAPQGGAPEWPDVPAEVTIAFVRSEDASQRVVQTGADSLCIIGVASSPGARLRIGVDGRIFSIHLRSGDAALDTVQRAADRLSATHRVETGAMADGSAVLRFIGVR